MPLLPWSVKVPTKTQNLEGSAAELGTVPRPVMTAEISRIRDHRRRARGLSNTIGADSDKVRGSRTSPGEDSHHRVSPEWRGDHFAGGRAEAHSSGTVGVDLSGISAEPSSGRLSR